MAGSIVLKIAGAAGEGIKSTGHNLQKAIQRLGYYTFGYTEYPSLIRGGHNTYQINFSNKPVHSTTQNIDILVALNSEGITKHLDELKKSSVIVCSQELSEKHNSEVKSGSKFVTIDVLKLLEENKLPPIVENTLLSGLVFKLLGFPLDELNKLYTQQFQAKGEKVVNMNLKALKLGFDRAGDHSFELPNKPKGKSKSEKIVLSANEAIALSFIASGGQIYSAYPMTPSTSILHYLAKHGDEHGVLTRQASTEIEAIGMAAGASFGGARCMVATSGGGLALMSEFISALGIMELPMVLVNAQRTGPATGLPTWTEQGDLQFSIWAGHGDFPKVVVAPGDAEEAFYLLSDSLNLADKYQTPVIFLTDKEISESFLSIDGLDTKKIKVDRGAFVSDAELSKMKDRFTRYDWDTKNGVSKRSIPGQKGGIYLANTDEHQVHGYSTEESDERNKMQEKRMKKFEAIKKDLPKPKIYGNKDGETLVIGWGSTKGAVLDAMEQLPDSTKQKIKFMQIQYLWPFPEEFVKSEIGKAKNTVLVENNFSAQLLPLIKQSGGSVVNIVTKYDGRPFWLEEAVDILENKAK